MNSDLGQDMGALIVGGGVVDRRLRDPMGLLDAYREDEVKRGVCTSGNGGHDPQRRAARYAKRTGKLRRIG